MQTSQQTGRTLDALHDGCKLSILQALKALRSQDDDRVRRSSYLQDAALDQWTKKAPISGCFLCEGLGIMREQIRQIWNESTSRGILVRFRVYHATSEEIESYDLMAQMDIIDRNGEITEIDDGALLERLSQVYQLDRLWCGDPLRDAASTSSLEEFTGSEKCAEMAAIWLKECLTQHKCRPNIKPAWVPKRLLHLGPKSARLVLSDREPPTGPYATLSHCWGGDLPLKLTSNNMKQLREGLKYEHLRPSFRDAVLTARRLKIDYIWIDCLCIIQGSDVASRQDWEEQSVQMGDVYAYGLVNIGATAARGANDGCFRKRNLDGSDWVIFKDQEHGETYRIGQKVFVNELEEEPLLHRGWVVQERQLCSRMLHFGAQQLYWQCAEVSIANELCPRGLDMNGLPVTRDNYRLSPGQLTTSDDILDTHALDNTWFGILGAYCDSGLSFPEKDKLRAISGVADYMGRQRTGIYDLGFFSSMLPRSLCWNTHSARHGRFDHKRRAIERGMPSWSWASMDGSLNFGDDCDETLQILTAQVVPSGSKTETKAIYLIGRLLAVSLQKQQSAYRRGDTFYDAYIGTGSWFRQFFFDDANEREEVTQKRKQLYLLPICTNLFDPIFVNKTESKPARERTSFLVLVRNADGTFCRAGAKRNLDDFANKFMSGSWIGDYPRIKPSLVVIV